MRKIKENIDLVSATPHAFMNSGDDNPKHSSKSQTMPLFQDAAQFGTESAESLFLIDGYPEITEDAVVVAVDGMNYIHHGVDQLYALTIRLHVDQVARRILGALPFSVQGKVALLDIHFDDYSRVPNFKMGEQIRRDEMRGFNAELAEPAVPVLCNIDAAPPPN